MLEKLIEITDKDRVKKDEPMSSHTTFRVGGPADYFVTVTKVEELKNVLTLVKNENVPYFLIGNGSNVLFKDEGYRGVVIRLSGEFEEVTVKGNEIKAGAGVPLIKVALKAYEEGLSGLEFASGIPGSVGGAVVMNAGAYGGEMKDVITKVTLLNLETLEIKDFSNEEMHFSYRHSLIKEEPFIVLSTVTALTVSDKAAIKAVMDDLREKRVTKQPLEYPSAGSTFKRPEGYFAGKLIEDAGLKGYRVGGAEVSEKHSGFVINRENATATDVLTLIGDVQNKVFEEFGVKLETEVIVINNK